MHAAGCRMDHLLKFKSEKQYISYTNTFVADTELKKKNRWHTETKESLLWVTVNGKLNLTATKKKLSANSSPLMARGLTSTVQTMGGTNMRKEMEPKTCCLIPSHPWLLPVTLFCSLARSQTHICSAFNHPIPIDFNGNPAPKCLCQSQLYCCCPPTAVRSFFI